MDKQEIMRLANMLIDELQKCDDGDFVDIVVSAICNADEFTDEEIEEEW
jgi:hypothetical protein